MSLEMKPPQHELVTRKLFPSDATTSRIWAQAYVLLLRGKDLFDTISFIGLLDLCVVLHSS